MQIMMFTDKGTKAIVYVKAKMNMRIPNMRFHAKIMPCFLPGLNSLRRTMAVKPVA